MSFFPPKLLSLPWPGKLRHTEQKTGSSPPPHTHTQSKHENSKFKDNVILSLFKCLSDCCGFESNSFLLLVRSLRLIFLLSKWNAAQLNWDQLINSASQECSRSWSRKAAFYLVGRKIKSKSQCPASTGSPGDPTPGRTTFFGSGSLSPSTYVPLSKAFLFDRHYLFHPFTTSPVLFFLFYGNFSFLFLRIIGG